MLDLKTFHDMVAGGVIPADGFLTIRSDKHEHILGKLQENTDVVEYFEKNAATSAQVCGLRVCAISETFRPFLTGVYAPCLAKGVCVCFFMFQRLIAVYLP